jgi:hypothetical protein
MRLIMLGAGLTAVITLAGLLAMTGTLRALISPQLSAEVHFADFPLPKGFGLEPQIVADFLVAELTTRATDDIALRLAMGTEGQKKVIEVAIPRLVNSVVVREMIAKIQPLANVLSVGNYRMSARVAVTNKGAARSDVALTMPGVVLVEAGTGNVAVETTSTGLTAVNLGGMGAGETRVLTVWLGQEAVDAGAGIGKQILLGDAGGDVGRVWLYGHRAWHGADLQAMPAARWMVGGALMVVFVASILVMLLAVLARLKLGRRRRFSPA